MLVQRHSHYKICFFFSSRRRHTRSYGDWSSDVCSSDLSGRTVNVTRRGPLLREERTLADGTVLVRYQYGNGPAHFEKRPKDGASRAPGYAYAPEHVTRPGRFDWLSR